MAIDNTRGDEGVNWLAAEPQPIDRVHASRATNSFSFDPRETRDYRNFCVRDLFVMS